MIDLSVSLGPLLLRSPLIGASGTVGSVVDFATVASLAPYGALVAKSVAPVPWAGNLAPRMAPVRGGMLNSIGIQNPGIEAWAAGVGQQLDGLDAPVWGSAVGHTPEDFARVAVGLAASGGGGSRGQPFVSESGRTEPESDCAGPAGKQTRNRSGPLGRERSSRGQVVAQRARCRLGGGRRS